MTTNIGGDWEQYGPNSPRTKILTDWLDDVSYDYLHTTKAEWNTEVKRYQNNIEGGLSPISRSSLTLTAETPTYKIKITKKGAEDEIEQLKE